MNKKALGWRQVAVLFGGLLVAGLVVATVLPWVNAAPDSEHLRRAAVVPLIVMAMMGVTFGIAQWVDSQIKKQH